MPMAGGGATKWRLVSHFTLQQLLTPVSEVTLTSLIKTYNWMISKTWQSRTTPRIEHELVRHQGRFLDHVRRLDRGAL